MYQMPAMNVNVIHHKQLLKIMIIVMKMGKENLEKEGKRWWKGGRGLKKYHAP